MPTFAFEVEYAKSGRAGCKKCKDKIAKDAVRAGFKAADGEEAHVGCSWYHFACLPEARGKAWFKKHLPADLAGVDGLAALRQEDRGAVEQLLLACRGEAEVPAAPAGPAPEETPAKGSKKRKAKEGGADESAGGAPVKAPKASPVLTAEQSAAVAEAKAKLAGKNAAWLGAALAKNGMPKSGRKDELVDRVAECLALGVPPECSQCGKRKLSWSRATGKYSCPGYFDDETKAFKRCKGPADGAEVRRTPWEEL